MLNNLDMVAMVVIFLIIATIQDGQEYVQFEDWPKLRVVQL